MNIASTSHIENLKKDSKKSWKLQVEEARQTQKLMPWFFLLYQAAKWATLRRQQL